MSRGVPLPAQARNLAAVAWFVGGALWVLAGLVADASSEPLWITADVVLLLALVTIARLGLHGRTRTGRAGLVVAGVGRMTFVVAEVFSAIQDKDQNALLPAAALLSAVGVTLYGAGVLRAHVWSGPGKFAPLAAGLYPFAVMFPIVVASGGEPSESAIALWGVALAAIGAALWLTAPASLRGEQRDSRTSTRADR